MIGLEYICNLHNVQYIEIAELLQISKQTINSWTSGRRKIPEKYLSILSKKFQVPEEYFQMDANIIKNTYVKALNKAIDNIDEPYKQSLIQLKTVLERMN